MSHFFVPENDQKSRRVDDVQMLLMEGTTFRGRLINVLGNFSRLALKLEEPRSSGELMPTNGWTIRKLNIFFAYTLANLFFCFFLCDFNWPF